MTKELKLHNDLSEVELLGQWCETVGEELELPMPAVFQLNLALEEAVTNVMNYAYPGQEGMPILLTLETIDGNTDILFTLTDEGIEFNPLEKVEAPDLSLSAEERPIGGLGVFLIKELMKSVEYHRENGKNILTMTYSPNQEISATL